MEKDNEIISILSNIVNRFTDYFSDSIENKHIPEESWHYIPYPVGFLNVDLEIIDSCLEDNENLNIIEVGCGIGVNAFFMKRYFNNSYVKGIDIDPKTLEIGKKLFGDHVEYLEKDAFEEDYSQFDIVFFYMPFSTEEDQLKFEEKVFEEISPGTVVFSGMFEHKIKKDNIIFVTPEIYVKK
ncbi:MAG: class I SAM-dependent methyltransferase [bacterium]